MTLLGKIFTVLIFIMSLVFMTFSVTVYITQRNWKDEYGKKTKELKDVQDERAALDRKLDEKTKLLAHEQAARKSAVASLESRLKSSQDDVAKLEIDNAKLKVETGEKTLVIKVSSDNVAKLTEEVGVLRTEIRKAQLDRDEVFKKWVALTDINHQQLGEVAKLTERHIQLTQQLAEYRNALNRLGKKPEDLLSGPVVADGIVLAVSPQGLVEISLGTDDGIREGHEFEVYRATQGSATYLGRIVIRRTKPERAVGEIIKDYLKGPIQTNDRVFTKVG